MEKVTHKKNVVRRVRGTRKAKEMFKVEAQRQVNAGEDLPNCKWHNVVRDKQIHVVVAK